MQSNVSLKNFSSFEIGGRARFFLKVSNLKELKRAFLFAKKNSLQVFILGRGTNTLFSDRGFPGLVIKNEIEFFKSSKGRVSIGSGFSFSRFGRILTRKGFLGFEFASHIPGTVGGALYMNAGAFGGDTFSFLESATFIDFNGEQKVFYRDDLRYGYRYSQFMEMEGFIYSADFFLKRSSHSKDILKEISLYRKRSQPNGKSIGSIFKNPENRSAGELIERCGLKGKRVGGAVVSNVHANFIINDQGATSSDVLELIALIKRKVLKKYNIELKEEISYVE